MLLRLGNNVETNFIHLTKSKQIEHVQFVSTLSTGQNFTINAFDIVAVFGNKVECCFELRSNIRLCSTRQCCIDIVAGVDAV